MATKASRSPSSLASWRATRHVTVIGRFPRATPEARSPSAG
jgi:hypothetical protein